MNLGKRVRVYRNLRRKDYSIMDLTTKRVVGHFATVWLDDVRFVVSEAGRNRAIREGQRNVHAFAEGTLSAVSTATRDPNGYVRVTYNPFHGPFFTRAALGGIPV